MFTLCIDPLTGQFTIVTPDNNYVSGVAGNDMECNDCGYVVGSREHTDILKGCEFLLEQAVSRGGNADKIREANPYIWVKESN